MTEDYCVPARKLNGMIASVTWARIIARQVLLEREGPPPFKGAVCRHLCENDSMAHKRENGFICTLHTTWGTYSQNKMDQSLLMRTQGPNNPNQSQKLQVTCPHCRKAGQHRAMSRWHFNNCKHKTLDVHKSH